MLTKVALAIEPRSQQLQEGVVKGLCGLTERCICLDGKYLQYMTNQYQTIDPNANQC